MNIAYEKALSLLDKHSLPFIAGNESDFLIARNQAIHEINFMRESVGIFFQDYWNDVHEELMKINYDKYRTLV